MKKVLVEGKEKVRFSTEQEEMLQALSDTIDYLDGTTDESAGLSDMLINIIGYLKDQWSKEEVEEQNE